MPDDALIRARAAAPAVEMPPAVLLVAMSYWPEPAGSAPMMTDLATAFAAAGTATTVLTARPNYPGERVYPEYAQGRRDHEEADGVRVERLPTIPPSGGGLRARLLHEGVLHTGFLAARALGRVRPHAAVLSLCPSIFSVAVAERFTAPGGRHVAIVHDIQSGLAGALGLGGGMALRGLRAVERLALNRADAVVVLSEPMRGVLRDLGVTVPIAVIPPHVDTERVHPLPRPPGRPPTVLYSGAFARKQGLEVVLEMAAILRSRVPAAQVVLRGQGGLEADLRERARRMELSNLVFETLAPKHRLNEGLAEGDVHLVPQRAEGAAFAMPGKAVTIMAAGRPFVCTCEAGSALERLGAEVAAFRCVPPGDAEAMADAVTLLLDNPAVCAAMGRRGRAWAEDNASRPVVLARYARLLRGEDPA